MDTIHNISTIRNKSNSPEQVRLGIVLAGIVTAIICSLILLKDIGSTTGSEEAGLPRPFKTLMIVPTNLVVDVNPVAVISAIFRTGH